MSKKEKIVERQKEIKQELYTLSSQYKKTHSSNKTESDTQINLLGADDSELSKKANKLNEEYKTLEFELKKY